MRKLSVLALALSMVAAACGGGGPLGGGGATDESAKAPGKDVKPAAKIVWWHAMGGINGEAINKIVAGFNGSQSAIKVETVFQGNYDDLLAKLNTAIASNAAPALVQVYDIGQAYMRDSAQVVPMQAFIDRDKFSTTDFEPAVINYYKYQDKLQSMPWNASSSILFYNKDAFKEVGLDPEKPPVTFSEVAEAAKKLTKKDASGQTVRYGFGPSIYGWLFEQLMATSAAPYADNGNGRDNRATKVLWNSAQGKAILDWWKAGVDGGYFYNPGIDNAGSTNAFNAGKTAMYIESTATLRNTINVAKFQVGTGLYPRPDNKPRDGGNIIGGASLYIMKSRPADEQQAAWEFVRYAMSPAIQAQWQADTGYYPIVKTAYNEGPSKEWATKYPQFLTAVNQIRESPQNRMTNGAVLGVMPQARQRTQKMIESVLLGQATSQAALEAAVSDINAAIDKYNKANP
ncbi:MAG TPA: ABC transporter substrate-binding protein [Candidatus Limnocylindria bacterium]|jgi:sn-glycerol 3-phosphate transport system substrate-binding protein|nr:ABC transporter substrate-binding protein [Candidatus Limnocylindria bacterium]